ncbi:Arc family DNA-binding protein [Brucella gallinifaecis]|uniref:Arc family DNA-binding protein n=1 Tax=Brucella gallinifaecis TaxID=215590 RepID=UPI002362021A|nr:Arc family DNA-binding protein [Brucella gallinifaecis]
MDDQEIRITLRLPFPLRDRLSESATSASRSMNGEIVERLEESFQANELITKASVERDQQKARADQLELDVRRLEIEKAAVEKELYDHQVTMTKQHHLILKQSEMLDSRDVYEKRQDSLINALERLSSAQERSVGVLLEIYSVLYSKFKEGTMTAEQALSAIGEAVEKSFDENIRNRVQKAPE